VLAVIVGPGFLLVSLAMVAFGIWVAVDASKYPDWAFQQARTQKWLFQILTPIAGFLCGFVAVVFGIIWFASKKAQVEQAARGGAPPSPGWAPPPAPGAWTPPPPPPDPSTPPPADPEAPNGGTA
jgi:hypothetical protein